MKDPQGLRIEPIRRRHRRGGFDCGEHSLNEYLARYARQNDERNLSRSFVAVDHDGRIAGYYSLSSAAVEFEELPERLAKSLPHYPIPAARISRLAVAASHHGQGLGAHLLVDALRRVHGAARQMGIKVVIVDALNESAREFYGHFGFIEFPGRPLNLFLPMETVAALFE